MLQGMLNKLAKNFVVALYPGVPSAIQDVIENFIINNTFLSAISAITINEFAFIANGVLID